MTQTHRAIPLATEKSAAQLTARQLTSYRDHRRRLIDWMLDRGKSPDRGRGYATSTTKIRAYRLDMFYRAVWDAEDRYTERITTAHADAWLEHLDAQDYTEAYKASCLKALLTLFEWKADKTNSTMDWEPVKQFKTEGAHQPRDFLTREERDQLREAALSYRSAPNYFAADDLEREDHRAYLAMRLGKPKEEISVDDWQQVVSWKTPSIIWSALDAGLRPIEVANARTSWVDTSNGVLRIPKEDSAKNTENWHTSITDRTGKSLERWLEERSRISRYEETDALWLTQHGNPYGSRSLNRLLRKILDETDIETEDRDLTWYSIRHSVGTYMTEKRDLKAAATQLRHKSTRTTVKYDQAPVKDRRDALDRMG